MYKRQIMNAATIFLGLSVGATMTSEAFLNWTTIGIVIGGFLANIARSDNNVCREEIEALKEVATYMGCLLYTSAFQFLFKGQKLQFCSIVINGFFF